MPFAKSYMDVLMSSDKQDWETPWDLYNPINELFNFTLDVCATEENTKVPGEFYSPEVDAFTQPWTGTWWMNPPYEKPESACKEPFTRCTKKKCIERGCHLSEYKPGLVDWIKYGAQQSKEHGSTGVCLIPARTDAGWFQTVFDQATLITFVKGRLKFIGADSGATFPSCVVVFSPGAPEDHIFEGMSELGNVIDPSNGGVFLYSGGKR